MNYETPKVENIIFKQPKSSNFSQGVLLFISNYSIQSLGIETVNCIKVGPNN